MAVGIGAFLVGGIAFVGIGNTGSDAGAAPTVTQTATATATATATETTSTKTTVTPKAKTKTVTAKPKSASNTSKGKISGSPDRIGKKLKHKLTCDGTWAESDSTKHESDVLVEGCTSPRVFIAAFSDKASMPFFISDMQDKSGYENYWTVKDRKWIVMARHRGDAVRAKKRTGSTAPIKQLSDY